MGTQVNLHPEKRKRLEKTDTSKFFEPSTLQGDVTMEDVPMRMKKDETQRDDEDEPPRRPMRQMRLDFSNGTMGTKKPFKNPLSRDDDARKSLADVATETYRLLPGLLQTRPDVGIEGRSCRREALDPKFCPRLSPVQVKVVSNDTIDAALDLQVKRPNSSSQKSVVILNMANAKVPGGGWQYGALAQEEAICYRTSLILTLKREEYPIPDDTALYSPRVMVIRDSIKNGHQIVDCTDPQKLKIISVVSCAAVCQPSLKTDRATGAKTYALSKDRNLMMEKMRIILRTVIRRRHRQIVLGAFGCGAFGNPNTEVAVMWKTILTEKEFTGGWWEDVCFAVLGDSKTDSNFKVFHDELDGLWLS